MNPTKNETVNQIDVFKLWKQAEAFLGRDIANSEVIAKSGVFNGLVKQMYEGRPVKADKVVKVIKTLYQISGMPKPTEPLHIQTVTTETWLQFGDEVE